ncbi:MAG: hypothetical protein WBC91_08420 [Phototrophicaceae bacterium]
MCWSPVTLNFDHNDELIDVDWFAQHFDMSPNMLPNGYQGIYDNGNAEYSLNVMFDNDPTTFYAILTVHFDWNPDCVWLIRWDGCQQ